jgi:hypothetical protein
MNITRRDFGKYTGTGLLALATGGSLALKGCNVFSDIEAWIPVGKTAFEGIVTLLQGAGLVSPAIGPIITVILR